MITVFDGPKAGENGTFAEAVNLAGEVAGVFDDTVTHRTHLFLRSANEQLKVFDAPNAVDTYVYDMNNAGQVTGVFYDANAVHHGFTRTRTGKFTVLNVPQSEETHAWAISPNGTVTGNYRRNNKEHAFVRMPNGSFQTFQVPPPAKGAGPIAINAAGEIAGTCRVTYGNGFLRLP